MSFLTGCSFVSPLGLFAGPPSVVILEHLLSFQASPYLISTGAPVRMSFSTSLTPRGLGAEVPGPHPKSELHSLSVATKISSGLPLAASFELASLLPEP